MLSRDFSTEKTSPVAAIKTSPPIIAAIATPPGRGGVGIVRVSGHDLSAIIQGVCGREALAHRRATLLPFLDDKNRVIDEGIALYFASPHSYTGENVLELQGHGGVAVTRAVLARVLALGAQLAEPGEMTRRAFLNGKMDLAQAEAVADLIDAATDTARQAAARSLTGAFSKEVNAIAEQMMGARVLIEASLDFPEEELDNVADALIIRQVSALREAVENLYRRAKSGAPLREGLTVVLVGAPNVGKSSLLNALTREEAAIVTPYAGTTRDAIERQISLSGIPLTVVDTAGLRETADEIEKIGIERAWRAIFHADMALVIFDAREAESHCVSLEAKESNAILSRLPPKMPRLIVWNKRDLLSDVTVAQNLAAENLNSSGDEKRVWISAKTGEGIDALLQAMLESVHITPITEDTFLARERHIVALKEALSELTLALEEIAKPNPAWELIAERLRYAHDALQTITGKIVADDLLGEIFSRFCIGK